MTGPRVEVVETFWDTSSSGQQQALLALLFTPYDARPDVLPVLAPGSGDPSPGTGASAERVPS